MPPHRRNVGFDAPLAILAGLQGTWSSAAGEDYALVRVGATTPMNVTRPRDGGTTVIERSSAKVRPTVQALAQLLGDRDQKVMAFLPRSRHDSFAAAVGIDGFGDVALDPVVQALLGLADSELGVPSLLTSTLAKGVGVHTSALLAEERRASELSFEKGETRVLFATGTLAQGLNLPATAVLIGGTAIGYDPEQTAAARRAQQRSQLLNAIGRAGRARVAARSFALVIPNELPVLDADTAVDGVLLRAEFLAQEDASTAVTSALRPFFSRLIDEEIDIDSLWASDHLVISYLAAAADDAIQTEIVQRSWAAYSLAARDQAQDMSSTLTTLGTEILQQRDAADWAAEAARRAGVPLPVAARFAAVLLYEANGAEPPNLDGWLDHLLVAISNPPPDELALLLDRDAFRSTDLDQLWADGSATRIDGATALRSTLDRWLAGSSLAAVGGAAHGTNAIATSGRSQQDPLPRTIRVIENGIVFGVARAAGLLAATYDVGYERGDLPPLSPRAHDDLERLPLALRFGAGGRVPLALIRAGARPRAVAHLLAARLPAPSDDADDEALRDWAAARIARLFDDLDDIPLNAEEHQLVAQFLIARDARKP